jgi:hypothetical protein
MFLICSHSEVRVNAGSPGWLGSSGLRCCPRRLLLPPDSRRGHRAAHRRFAVCRACRRGRSRIGRAGSSGLPGSSNRVTGPSALQDPSWARPERANFPEGGVRISTGRAGVREDPAGWRPKADYVKTVLCPVALDAGNLIKLFDVVLGRRWLAWLQAFHPVFGRLTKAEATPLAVDQPRSPCAFARSVHLALR